MTAQPRHSEIAILVIVSLMSFMANLPNQLTGSLIDKRLLLIALTLAVLIALLKHLRALLSLSIIILAIGANLPEALAESAGIRPMVMTISLAAIVALTLLSKAFKLLPSGIGSIKADADDLPLPANKIDAQATRLALLITVSKGDAFTLDRMLDQQVDVNFSLDGLVPLLVAARRGYFDIAQTLIRHGADFRVRDKDGRTIIEIALANNDRHSAELLYNEIKLKLSSKERMTIVDLFYSSQNSLAAD